VCRKSYIDPAVFEAWEDGRLHRFCKDARGPRQWEQAPCACSRARARGSGAEGACAA
jgi:hypothetical protein